MRYFPPGSLCSPKMAVLNLTFFLLLQTSISICHFMPEDQDIVRGVKHVLRRRSTELQSLRIKIIVQNMTKKSSKVQHVIIDKLLPDAVNYFAQTFKVRQSTSSITLHQKCKSSVLKQINGDQFCVGECVEETMCGPVAIPQEHLAICQWCDNLGNCRNETSKDRGVNDTDFILYVSSVVTKHCNISNDVIAYAATCQQEYVLDRPVAGFVNFCPARISEDIHYNHLLAVVKHEIYHALGFSSALYGYYRADDGTPLTNRRSDGKPVEQWSDKVVKSAVRQNWQVSDAAGTNIAHKVEMLVTPRVVKEVRKHFNCSTLEGAEIENQGGKGRQQTHLEKRLFENEAMTGVFTHNPVFSRITLAVMEDTGWYHANYDMAEGLDWGSNAGCLFVQNSCKAWMDDKAQRNESVLPFCKQVEPSNYTKTTCTHGYDSVGTCNLVQYNTLLPNDYRYFNSLVGVSNPGHYAGAVSLADYCPYIQELDWKKDGKVLRSSNCKYTSNNLDFDKNYALEEYGANSSCFQHGRKWQRKSCSLTVIPVDWGSGCYQYTCSTLGVVVSVMGRSFPCFIPGETIEIKFVGEQSWLHEGLLVCPPCQDFCHMCPALPQDFNTPQKKHNQKVLMCHSSEIHACLGIVLFSLSLHVWHKCFL